MIPEFKDRVALRLSTEHREAIEALIKKGKFKNLSEVIRAALAEFLAKNQ